MHLAKTKPKLLCRELCPIPAALCMGTQTATETLIPDKKAGLEVPEELLTTDRGEGSSLGLGSTLPTYRAAFNLSLPRWPSPGDNFPLSTPYHR